MEREAKLLLPIEYYHVVFTLPHELTELALANPKVHYDALFQAASATLRDLAADPKRLGAQLGVLMVLHTWGQKLNPHPHVHAVVTGGGLSCDAHGNVDKDPQWRACRAGFLLPVRVMSRVFRGKYLELLRAAFDQGQLIFPGRCAALAHGPAFARWLTPLYHKDWEVYAKRPFGGPAQVLKYLAGYTHRVAISNHRLMSLEDGWVTFRYKDYANHSLQKTMRLTAEEFLRRFVQHVLPTGFWKIRHYGLLAGRNRAEKLQRCRSLLLPSIETVTAPGLDPALVTSTVTAALATVGSPGAAACDTVPIAAAWRPHCPQCGSQRLLRLPLPEGNGYAFDSS